VKRDVGDKMSDKMQPGTLVWVCSMRGCVYFCISEIRERETGGILI
jgi:hypothetical protein